MIDEEGAREAWVELQAACENVVAAEKIDLRAALRLLDLVTQYARAFAGELDLTPDDIDALETVAFLADTYSPDMPDKRVIFERNLSEPRKIGIYVALTVGRCRQIRRLLDRLLKPPEV